MNELKKDCMRNYIAEIHNVIGDNYMIYETPVIQGKIIKKFNIIEYPNLAEEYKTEIKNPICFNEILDKIENDSYSNEKEFKNDLDLLWKNSNKFNANDAIMLEVGKQLKNAISYNFKSFKKALHEITENKVPAKKSKTNLSKKLIGKKRSRNEKTTPGNPSKKKQKVTPKDETPKETPKEKPFDKLKSKEKNVEDINTSKSAILLQDITTTPFGNEPKPFEKPTAKRKNKKEQKAIKKEENQNKKDITEAQLEDAKYLRKTNTKKETNINEENQKCKVMDEDTKSKRIQDDINQILKNEAEELKEQFKEKDSHIIDVIPEVTPNHQVVFHVITDFQKIADCSLYKFHLDCECKIGKLKSDEVDH